MDEGRVGCSPLRLRVDARLEVDAPVDGRLVDVVAVDRVRLVVLHEAPPLLGQTAYESRNRNVDLSSTLELGSAQLLNGSLNS